MNPIRFLQPTFPPAADIAADYAAIVARGMFSNSGPLERELTGRIQSWVGNGTHAALVTNCTVGLGMAITATFHAQRPMALVPSFTFAAGPLALRNAGFVPVFLDVDPVTWQPRLADAARFLAARAGDVAGILLTSTFGVADPDIARWEYLAESHGLPLVIDSAAGFGAQHSDGEPVGARGTCEVFSLHATKMLSIGEGGVITSRDAELIERLNCMKNFGFDSNRVVVAAGTNAKLPELSAAIGLRQLDVFADRIALRRAHLQRYVQELEPLGVRFQPGSLQSAPAFASALLPIGLTRQAVREELVADGIECREYYNPPVHLQPHFAGLSSCSGLTVTEDLSAGMLSLPMADDLDPDAAARVAAAVRRAAERTRGSVHLLAPLRRHATRSVTGSPQDARRATV